MTSKLRLLLLAGSAALPYSFAQVASSPPKPQTGDLYSLDLESLLNVKVTTASKFSERLSDAPGVMTVVTKDELQRFGGITLSEILERVPGLALSAASFTDRSIIAARGDQTKINGGHVLFLINGRPTREVLEGGLVGDLLESFPAGILEKIEVIRGPGSVLYGSNAYSAVINLITRKADGDSLTLKGMGAQGAGAVSSGQFSLQRGDLSVVGAGQFHEKPTWYTPVWTGYGGLQNEAIPDRSKGGYLGVNYKGLSLMSSYTEWRSAYIEGEVGDARWRRAFADLGYVYKPNGKWDMNFNLTFTRTALSAVTAIPFIDRDSSELVAEWSNEVTLSSRNQLTFGTLFNYIHGVEHFYFGAPSTIAQGSRPGEAFYVQLDHDLIHGVKLVGGIQANKIGNLSLDVVPRGGVIWSPNSRFSVKALYSQAFRAPSLNETLLDYEPPAVIGGPSLKGNIDLRPEKVATIDLGFGYQGKRFQAGFDLFHSRQTDNIILVDPTTAGRYVNLGEASFHGVEGEGKYYLKNNFFFTGSVLYQTNRDGNGNTNITPIANVGVKAGVGYQSQNGWSAGLFHVYQGPLNGYGPGPNPTPGAYHLMNANLRYDLSRYLPLHSTTLAFVSHADNLLNIPVWLPDWKDNPGGSIFSNRGRTLYFGIEVGFKKGD